MEREYDEQEAYIRQMRREKRRQEIRRKRRRQAMIRRAVFSGVLVLAAAVIVLAVFLVNGKKKENTEQKPQADLIQEADALSLEEADRKETESLAHEEEPEGESEAEPEETPVPSYEYETTDSTLNLGSEFVSTNAVFVDIDQGTILAQKDAKARINPASMTKVLTLLVAAEHIDNPGDTFTVTAEATDYGYVNDCSVAGFEKEETVTVRDLMYGTILPSGADAAMGLALYVSGSQEAFVDLMNEKLSELGLSDSAHFTNCVGVYGEDHYCTVYDLAVIMNAAIENETCREVMSAHTYNTSATEQHPEGLLLSNWFLRRIEDKDTGGEVVCGKTGFVNQSGNCAVSYGVDQSGRNYICVTAGATSAWRCIYDHVDLYKRFSE